MKCYKTKKVIKEGKVYYGNLPYKFIVGYENETEAYFQLVEFIELPSNAEVQEITKEEFNSFVQSLVEKEEENRKSDYNVLLEQYSKAKTEKDLLLKTLAQVNLDNAGLQKQLKTLTQTITNMQLGGIK